MVQKTPSHYLIDLTTIQINNQNLPISSTNSSKCIISLLLEIFKIFRCHYFGFYVGQNIYISTNLTFINSNGVGVNINIYQNTMYLKFKLISFNIY